MEETKKLEEHFKQAFTAGKILDVGIVCAGCGTHIPFGKIRGSLKLPYCEKCFKRIWNDDYKAYSEWLDKEHFF